MTLSGYFMSNSVFGPAVSDSDESTVKELLGGLSGEEARGCCTKVGGY